MPGRGASLAKRLPVCAIGLVEILALRISKYRRQGQTQLTRPASPRIRARQVKIDLAFITHNRLDYTKLALASVLADPQEQFSLTLWDNASTDGTARYLENEVRDPRIKEVVLSKKNVGQIAAVNEVWGRSCGDLVGRSEE